ncbi:MAG TPA: ring-cleaving dioxygenase [Pseudacidobacterium sp.]|jgi:catechol 2,3-dioxygenase-like lactoylglutathione lyase family enzyme|nr:ring-cleaving dioxygenase [Pseudacidobacterium sp.]
MPDPIPGIHHITAIATDAQRNVDFYVGVLGLRLVKRTVNFDDPGTYHLYFGDEKGNPGTILTFFPWTGIQSGRRGTGQATAIGFAVPQDSFGFWIERFTRLGVEYDRPQRRLDEQVLAFRDRDGLALELIGVPGVESKPAWEANGISGKEAIRSFHTVTLCEDGMERTAELLTSMGAKKAKEEGSYFRYTFGEGESASNVDLHRTPEFLRGVVAGGSVHHVAYRVPNDAAQVEWQEKVREIGLNVTPVLDRQYFKSIYFREPGGVLFEIATDPPGFAVDEPESALGQVLKLPPWLEKYRADIEESLPKLHQPELVAEKQS